MNWICFLSACCYAEKRKFKQLKKSTEDRNLLMGRNQNLCCLRGSSVVQCQQIIHLRHLTGGGKVFGIALSRFNLQAKTTRFLTIFCHH